MNAANTWLCSGVPLEKHNHRGDGKRRVWGAGLHDSGASQGRPGSAGARLDLSGACLRGTPLPGSLSPAPGLQLWLQDTLPVARTGVWWQRWAQQPHPADTSWQPRWRSSLAVCPESMLWYCFIIILFLLLLLN